MFEALRRRSYDELYTRIGKRLTSLPTELNCKVLDIGCGDGTFTDKWAQSLRTNNMYAVDSLPQKIKWPLKLADIDKGLPYDDNTFDVITCIEVLEHVKYTDVLVQEIYRILKPGGFIVLSTPNMANARLILQLILDKQPDEAHVSDYFIPRGDSGECWKGCIGYLHRRLFTVEGLKRLLLFYNFKNIKYERTGYGLFIFGRLLKGKYAATIIMEAQKGK